MTKGVSSHTEAIRLYITECRSGWIMFDLSIGDHTFSLLFSEVFDPLPSLLIWLESLALGVYQAGFYYDEEGREYIWSCTQRNWKGEDLFDIRDISDEERKIMSSKIISRKNLISSLYQGFRDFYASDRYDPLEYENIRVIDYISRVTETPHTEALEYLLDQKRDDLDEILQKIIPYSVTYSYPHVENTPNAQFNQFLKEMDSEVSTGVPEIIDRTYDLPIEWDTLEKESKRERLTPILDLEAGYYSGMRSKDFHSEIIEKYLENT